ncbi:MAG: NAD-dependent epimerase/dehydratase family protein [Acidobacteria bacterium]|nr:NAD-dependent epimerase/dehydratase family protein [Acidobacteriota bacterium]
MARYLVTGGAGFIGSHVVDDLVERGHEVRVVDDLSTGSRDNLAAHADIDLIAADLADPKVAAAAVADVDYVVHMAAMPSVPRSVKEPRRAHRANVDATFELLLASRGSRVRRVVLASSASVYGDSAARRQHERLRPAPLSPYALHKLVGEQYAELFNRLHGLETVALRFFNVFGPRQSPDSQYASVIPRFAAALLVCRPGDTQLNSPYTLPMNHSVFARSRCLERPRDSATNFGDRTLAGGTPTIHGDGEQTRDFTYVADAVRGVVQACAGPAAARVVNIARGEALSVNALCSMLQRITGAHERARHADDLTGGVRHSQADVSLARDLLGFAPAVPVEEGLRRTMDWYRRRMPPARRPAQPRGLDAVRGDPRPADPPPGGRPRS